jgi:hypothetical protein
LAELPGLHQRRKQGHHRGDRDRELDADDQRDDDDSDDAGPPRRGEHGQDRGRRHGEHLHRDQHLAAIEHVREAPSRQGEEPHGHEQSGRRHPHRERAPRQVFHEHGLRGQLQPVAGVRDQLSEEEQPEVTIGEQPG